MQSLELVKSSELIMVFRISKIHTNADFTFSNNKENSVDKIVKKYFPDKNKDETVMLLDKILEDYFSKNKDIVQHAE